MDNKEIGILLTEIKKDLNEHMRRTEILEGHVGLLNIELVKLKTFYMILGWAFGAFATAITLGLQAYRAFHG